MAIYANVRRAPLLCAGRLEHKGVLETNAAHALLEFAHRVFLRSGIVCGSRAGESPSLWIAASLLLDILVDALAVLTERVHCIFAERIGGLGPFSSFDHGVKRVLAVATRAPRVVPQLLQDHRNEGVWNRC